MNIAMQDKQWFCGIIENLCSITNMNKFWAKKIPTVSIPMYNEIIFYITLIKLNTYLGLFKEILYRFWKL